jgi:hypothetical protein
LYTVYCFNGSTEVAQIALDGAALNENKALFRDLSASTEYQYQVEAYLNIDQSASEKSDKIDRKTARRMRPGAPVKLRATRGTSKSIVELSFELPDYVDIPLGADQFDSKPVYFVISKRRYSPSGHNEYQIACSYFGSISENATKSGDKIFNDYTPGKAVTWTDDTVSRGIEYEYQVQSYVDDTPKLISSDDSKASAEGWALSEGSLDFGEPDYTINENGSQYISAQLPLTFDFDPKNVTYGYSLVETIERIGDGDENDPSATVTRTSDTLTYSAIKNYVAQMNLTQQTTAQTPGRGVYSYKVEIKLNGEPIDTVSTLGKVEVSEVTDPIIVDGFSVEDGYTDRFVLKWHYHENRKYVLYASNDRINWDEIDTVNPNPVDAGTVRIENYAHTYTAGVTTGLTKYFAIRPYRDIGSGFKQGQMVYASAASRTLGVPVLSLSGDGPSYSEITVAWTPVQMADTYRIKYRYTGDGGSYQTAKTISKDDPALSVDAHENFKYAFMPFSNNTLDAAKAGLELQVTVDALNEGLRERVGGGEIATTSHETVTARLVGPALLNPAASQALSPTVIDVSWDKISGASGYYVFRRQFNMNNTAQEGTDAIVYYVPDVNVNTTSITITGKDLMLSAGTKEDTPAVKAAASFAGSRYTLKDIYMNDGEYNGSFSSHTPAYREQQNNIAQGFTYRYYVVPVVNRSGAPEPLTSINFTSSGSTISYTIRENNRTISYNNAAALEKDGFTIGFGQNVTATKGTYTSNPSSNYPTSDGIRITWSAPPRLPSAAGITPVYEVWRKAYNATTWDKVNTVNNALNYTDSSASLTKGIVYEYLIGISNGSSASEPKDSARFVASCRAMKDEKGRSHMLGYMLDLVRMESVSRNEQKVGNDFAEEVKWFNAGVKYSADNNTDYRWGIDGYTVFVMNRNIDAGWHEIADIPYANIPNQTNQSVKVAANTKFSAEGRDLLRVLRDYKHFFKVRSYVLNGSEKVYCLDPSYDYEALYRANRNALETDYVKWGARQVTHTEFVKIATLAVQWGISQVNGAYSAGGTGGWVSTLSLKTRNGVDTGPGGSGSVSTMSSSGVGMWWFDFNNYKPALDTRANKGENNYKVAFVTIHTNSDMNGNANQRKGTIYADAASAGRLPNWYGVLYGYRSSIFSTRYDYGTEFFDVKGPDDVPGLYTGKMLFNGDTTENYSGVDSNGVRMFKWGSGNSDGYVAVQYPAGTAQVNVRGGQANTPLHFASQSETYRQDLDAWY